MRYHSTHTELDRCCDTHRAWRTRGWRGPGRRTLGLREEAAPEAEAAKAAAATWETVADRGGGRAHRRCPPPAPCPEMARSQPAPPRSPRVRPSVPPTVSGTAVSVAVAQAAPPERAPRLQRGVPCHSSCGRLSPKRCVQVLVPTPANVTPANITPANVTPTNVTPANVALDAGLCGLHQGGGRLDWGRGTLMQ